MHVQPCHGWGRPGGRPSFSLVELVIVIVIIGIIAAIAVPRFGSAADHASRTSVQASARVLQNAIDLWHAERSTSAAPYPPADELAAALMSAGPCSTGGGSCGPYLRQFPSNPYFPGDGIRAPDAGGSFVAACDGSAAWVYDPSSGRIGACVDKPDAACCDVVPVQLMQPAT